MVAPGDPTGNSGCCHSRRWRDYRDSVETPRARPVDPHAYLGPDEPELRRSVGQRVRSWLGWILAFTLGSVGAAWNLTWWVLGVFAITLVAVVVDRCKRQVAAELEQPASSLPPVSSGPRVPWFDHSAAKPNPVPPTARPNKAVPPKSSISMPVGQPDDHQVEVERSRTAELARRRLREDRRRRHRDPAQPHTSGPPRGTPVETDQSGRAWFDEDAPITNRSGADRRRAARTTHLRPVNIDNTLCAWADSNCRHPL